MTGSLNEADTAMRAYWEALGRFVTDYAETETSLNILLSHVAAVRHEMARAVFSGVRADASVSLINRVLDATKQQTIKADMKRHFDQFGVVTRTRNDILHYGVRFDGRGQANLSNWVQAHTPDRLREFRVAPSDLDSMCSDLYVIRTAIMLAIGGRKISRPSSGSLGRRSRGVHGFIDCLRQHLRMIGPRKILPRRRARPTHLLSDFWLARRVGGATCGRYYAGLSRSKTVVLKHRFVKYIIGIVFAGRGGSGREGRVAGSCGGTDPNPCLACGVGLSAK